MQRLGTRGVRLARVGPPPDAAVRVKLSEFTDPVAVLNSTFAATQHIRLDCPAFRLPPSLMVQHEKAVFAGGML